jgi:hypothetical protein
MRFFTRLVDWLAVPDGAGAAEGIRSEYLPQTALPPVGEKRRGLRACD